MEQSKIWEYFQNDESISRVSFANATPRYRFIAKQVKPREKALNIGVGAGGLEAILLAKGVDVSCLDPSEASIAALRQRLPLGERARIGVSQSMPFEEKEFDVVIMSEVLEHLTDEVLFSSLKEVRRVLRPGGRFIGTVPADEDLRENAVICPHCGDMFHRWGHVRVFSRESMSKTLGDQGFRVRRCEVRAFPDWGRKSVLGFAKSAAKYLLGRIGDRMVVPGIFFVAETMKR